MIKFKVTGETITCTFPARVETTVCMQYQAEVEPEVLNAGKPVVFDMKDTEYICSAFLRICIAASQKLGKEKFSVIHTNSFVHKVFHVAGLENLIRIS
ncbi:MAG: STAS domain-containing protein [Elusimicrobiaceae bacterium]|jgi:anti-anti-sigma factor